MPSEIIILVGCGEGAGVGTKSQPGESKLVRGTARMVSRHAVPGCPSFWYLHVCDAVLVFPPHPVSGDFLAACGAGALAQPVSAKPGKPAGPQNPHGKREEVTLTSCPLTFTCMHVYSTMEE